jgi:5'-deoxynucleotidase YfbR-like HD superfamily hydrolase
MIYDLVEKYLMRPKRLREAIQAVVHDNDELLRIFKEYEKDDTPTNLTWSEGDTWYGWTYNRELKRYYFDDIGNTSLMGLWEDQWLREADESSNV